MTDDPTRLTLAELSGLIHAGDLSPRDLAETYLKRIEALNPALNAFISVLADEALAAARQVEDELRRGEDRGPLHGIPIAVKDNIDVAGARTSAGSSFLRDNVPARDAEVVRRLRAAGAILIGKTNLHEWALGATTINPHFGPALNPWNLDYSPGGSSGGSAAAVAAGCCAAALGTDTGGSVRLPAAVCNLTGVRPPHGWLPTEGAIPVSESLDVIGLLARTAQDCALLLKAMAGNNTLDAASDAPASLASVTLAVPQDDAIWSKTDSDIARLAEEAIDLMSRSGAQRRSITLPALREATRAAGILSAVDPANYHRARLESAPEGFGEDVRRLLERGLRHTADDYEWARQVERKWREELSNLFASGIDVIALPTTPVHPPAINNPDDESIRHLLRLTFPFSLGGLPSLSMSCGFAANGLPVGLQLIGRDLNKLLCVAQAYQHLTDWHTRRPALP